MRFITRFSETDGALIVNKEPGSMLYLSPVCHHFCAKLVSKSRCCLCSQEQLQWRCRICRS